MNGEVDSGESVSVLHAAIFAQRQPLAGGLQLLGALVRLFARLQAFGSRLMGFGHGAVAGDVFLDFFITMLCHYPPG